MPVEEIKHQAASGHLVYPFKYDKCWARFIESHSLHATLQRTTVRSVEELDHKNPVAW